MDYSGKIITKNPVEPSQTSAPGVWTLDQATQAVQGNNWPIAYVPNPISRSLRFNSADTTYLNRTPATAGTSATVWTFSWWQKGIALNGSTQVVFGAESGGSRDLIRWDGSGTLEFYKATSAIRVLTPKYRDPSAWYHFVINVSGTTVGVYTNGVQVTAFSTSNNPAGNWYIGQAYLHRIGLDPTGGDALNGYLTEINFIDGQALDASYFGMTDPRTGAWIPKKYSGTYGTNGFYLNFSDNSTTAALGTDYSGNSNTWTTNGFSVTAGSGNDSMTDVPTPWIPYNTTGDVGGVVRGNYATLNPLRPSGATLSNGNLDAVTGNNGSSNSGYLTSTFWMPESGKYYFEVTPTSVGEVAIGLTTNSNNRAAIYYRQGDVYINGSISFTGSSYTNNDVIGVAVDMDALTIRFYKNNTAQGSGTSSLSGMTGPFVSCVAHLSGTGSSTVTANFGQRPFAYTPPAGFKSLCTTNLPEPTVLDGGDYFNAVLWNGASSGSSLNVTGFGFQPDFIWTKSRNNSYDHYLQDAVRGIGVGNQNTLSSNSTAAEADTAGLATSFLSDGFNINSTAGSTSLGNTEVTWAWKAGGTGVSVAAGDSNYGSPSLASTLSVNTTAGFSISTYTGNNTSGATVAHGLKVDGLGVAPAMVICKNRTAGIGSGAWPVWHKSLSGGNYYLFLNTTAAQANGNNNFTSAPTSTLVNLGTSDTNNTADMVMYCFAAVPGYSAFGSYTGNGSTDGSFIYTGFRPRYVLMKSSTQTSPWQVFDTARDPTNVCGYVLLPNSSAAESSFFATVDILSNGFKLRYNGDPNTSGQTYIYAAFAENPFKYSNAR